MFFSIINESLKCLFPRTSMIVVESVILSFIFKMFPIHLHFVNFAKLLT